MAFLKLTFFFMFTLLILSCGSPLQKMDVAEDQDREEQPDEREDDGNERPPLLSIKFKTRNLYIDKKWVLGPKTKQESILQLQLLRLQDDQLKPAELEQGEKLHVYLWMPDHNHGARPVTIALENRVYTISQIFFSMPGHWDIHIQLKSGERIIDEAFVSVNL